MMMVMVMIGWWWWSSQIEPMRARKKWKVNGLQMSNFRKIELYTITRIKKGKIKERKQKQTECFSLWIQKGINRMIQLFYFRHFFGFSQTHRFRHYYHELK